MVRFDALMLENALGWKLVDVLVHSCILESFTQKQKAIE